MHAHFEELTHVGIHKTLNQSIQEYGKVLVDFFKTKPSNNTVKNVLSAEEDFEPLVIKLILAHFKEDPAGLLLLADLSSHLLLSHLYLNCISLLIFSSLIYSQCGEWHQEPNCSFFSGFPVTRVFMC
ncbi:hypothetical protein DNTS_007876 [Danionella cerebrum]|uniref:Uncharacterized protein n=1 Tax=Danionella cerebrum TaxID=2873325 RepID=A0A553NAD8_9TELE|nr:hypothetical protein DNTS_007876 [Danionella translucida]